MRLKTMQLKVMLPTRILLDTEISKVSGESPEGSFTILPRHIDYVTALSTGICRYVDESGKEFFLAVDGGILIKRGDSVLLSTPRAVKDERLGRLENTINEEYLSLDEKGKEVQTAFARLESDFTRKILNWNRSL